MKTTKDSGDGWSVGLVVRHRLGVFRVINVDRSRGSDVELSVESVDDPRSSFKDYAFYFEVDGTPADARA